MAIAKRLLKIIESHGVSVFDLSQASSMHEKCINRFLRGRENFCIETLLRFLGAIKMSLKVFFDAPEFEEVVTTLAVEEKMVSEYFEAIKATRQATEQAEASASDPKAGN
jgi:hypothetical protein